jgi:DNA-binding GntR family transcriptional regulator
VKKPGLAVLLGEAKPEDDEDAPASERGGDSKSEAQRILDAIKAGDADELDDALKGHYAACEGD